MPPMLNSYGGGAITSYSDSTQPVFAKGLPKTETIQPVQDVIQIGQKTTNIIGQPFVVAKGVEKVARVDTGTFSVVPKKQAIVVNNEAQYVQDVMSVKEAYYASKSNAKKPLNTTTKEPDKTPLVETSMFSQKEIMVGIVVIVLFIIFMVQ